MSGSARSQVAGHQDGTPILASHDAENTPLLNATKERGTRTHWKSWREIVAFVWAFAATVVVVILAVLYQHQAATRSRTPADQDPAKHLGRRNLIFMVSDGMGPASLSLTRSFRQNITNLPINDLLVLDQHLIGQSRTRSSNSLVTDSAAGATAFSCGLKSYNGAISMLPNHTPCGTVMEAAKRAGYTTGLVVTTRITDATPACFASHADFRSEEDSIARQLIGDHPLGHTVDLLFGGGRCHFIPQGKAGSCRADKIDVIENAKDNGYNYIESRNEFDRLKGGKRAKLPILGLFSPTDIPYEIDRRTMNDVFPSLDEMARTALEILKAATKDTEKGFFLMVEGSRIDHAGHGNDPAAQVHEVLAYDKAFGSVLEFLDDDDTHGVLVATSDHETGGLALARQLHRTYPEYQWFPDVLARANHSGEFLGQELKEFKAQGGRSKSDIEIFVRKQIRDGLGINDATDDEVRTLVLASSIQEAAYTFADMVSRRAQLGWSTHGHSGKVASQYSCAFEADMCP